MSPEARRAALLAGAVGGVALFGWLLSRCPSGAGGGAGGASGDAGDGAPTTTTAGVGDGAASDEAPLAPARCDALATTPATLGNKSDDPDVLVGDAVAAPGPRGGFAVGVVRGGENGVVRVDASLAGARFVSLGPAHGDAPPPRPFVVDGRLWVARYEEASGKGKDAAVASRRLVLARADDAEAAFAPVAAVDQGADASYDFDLLPLAGRVLVAWDDETSGESVIRLARVATADGAIETAPATAAPTAPTPIASPASPAAAGDASAPPPPPFAPLATEAADASSPRLFARAGGGALVAWIARRADTKVAADASPDELLEGPGEHRLPQWLETAAIDAQGRRVAPPRRATSATGEITGFDALAAPDGASVDLVARDAAEPREGAGGRLAIVHLAGEGPAEGAPLVREGVGRGDPDVVASGATGSGKGGAFYVDPADHTRFVPFEGGRASGAASVEPSLEGARVLLAVTAPPPAAESLRLLDGGHPAAIGPPGGPAGPGTVLLVAAPAALKLVFCGR